MKNLLFIGLILLASCSKSSTDNASTITPSPTASTSPGTGSGGTGTGGAGSGGGSSTPVTTKIVGIINAQFVYTAAQRFQDFEATSIGSQLFIDTIGALPSEGKFINGGLGTLTVNASSASVQELHFSNILTGPPQITTSLTAADTAGKIYWKFTHVLNFDTLIVVPCINGIPGSGLIRYFSVSLPPINASNYSNYINVKGHVASAIGF